MLSPLGVIGVLGPVVHHQPVVDKVEAVGARLEGRADHLGSWGVGTHRRHG